MLRAKAESDAMLKAATYAHSASVKLGRLIDFSASYDSDYQSKPNQCGADDLPIRNSPSGTYMFTGPPPARPIPVEPGAITLAVALQATWELAPE
jgi:uncharacterized protein YggE